MASGGGVTIADLAMLEERVEQLERIYGKNNSEKEAVKVLEELNVKVGKILTMCFPASSFKLMRL